MSREQLEAFCIKLRNELEREREERNFFQIERDKLRTFWEITRKQHDDSQAIIRNKEREVEVAQEMADLDVKNVLQQMKHLQYENQARIGDMRAEMMTQLKLAQEDHAMQERELFTDIRELKKLLREKDELNELQIQQIKVKHSEELSLEREKFQNEIKEMANLHERRLQEYMENSEIRHRMEMSEVEERKNNQIKQLIDCHEKAFGEMKSYYNDITINNLALISSIKEQMEEMRRQTERNEKQMADAHSGIDNFHFTKLLIQNSQHTKSENPKNVTLSFYFTAAQTRSITEPVKDNQAEMIELRKKLENYQKDKLAMQKLQKRYESIRKQNDNLKMELDAKILLCDKITEERDELRQKFEDAILDVQQKSSKVFRNFLSFFFWSRKLIRFPFFRS
jgi:growth arrest-specific protein 8